MFGTWPRNAERAFPPEPVLGSKPLVLDNHPRIVRAGLPDHRVFIGLILNSSGLGGTAGNASGGRHLEERFLERRTVRGRKDDGRSPATVREPGDFLCHALADLDGGLVHLTVVAGDMPPFRPPCSPEH